MNSQPIDPKTLHLINLFMKFDDGTITPNEQEKLDDWVDEDESNRQTMKRIIIPARPSKSKRAVEQRKAHFKKVVSRIRKSGQEI